MEHPQSTSGHAVPGNSPLTVLLIGIGLAVLLILAWLGRVILMLLFAAIVVAVLMTAMVDWMTSKLKLRRGLAFALILLVATVATGITLWLSGPAIFKPVRRPADRPSTSCTRADGEAG